MRDTIVYNLQSQTKVWNIVQKVTEVKVSIKLRERGDLNRILGLIEFYWIKLKATQQFFRRNGLQENCKYLHQKVPKPVEAKIAD